MARMEKIESPYRKASPAEPSNGDAESLQRDDSRSGAGKSPRSLSKVFEDRQRQAHIDEPQIADSTTRRFLYALAEQKASSATVLDEVASRALRAPSRRNLERMQAVANEIGKRRGGGKRLREVVTQDLLDQLAKVD